ncbi:MAG: mechanosensitive ion channel [Gammaproteobacteria bacterium]|nr:mechanosensitive ion channel [Gammaproteobacteria bacterium]
MPRITQLTNQLSTTLIHWNTAESWWQFGGIGVAIIVAFSITRFLGQVLTKRRLGPHDGMRPLLTPAVQRVVFPALALVLVSAFYSLFHLLDESVQWLRIASILLSTFAGVRILFFWLGKQFAPTPTFKTWQRIISILIWLAVLLYLTDLLSTLLAFLDSLALSVGDSRISLLSAINFVILVAILFSLAIWLSTHMERRLYNSDHISVGWRVGLAKITRVVLITLAVMIALDAAGISLTAFAVFGGAIGVGLGFGLQRIASNFISGFLVLFDRSIRPGDLIKIGDRLGQVLELHARYIVVKDFDGVSTLIPNENLITNDVVNWSYGEHKIRLKIPVEISYDDDPERVLQMLKKIADDHPRVLADPPVDAQLVQFGDNGLKLELYVWIDDPENGMANVRSQINIRIWNEFKSNNIHFPYPQHDVNIKGLPGRMEIPPP